MIRSKWNQIIHESNACQVYDAECVSKIKTILSIIFIFTIWGCVSSAYPILLLWSRECVLYLIIIIKPEVWIINHCLGLGHETMVCAVCLTMFFLIIYDMAITSYIMIYDCVWNLIFGTKFSSIYLAKGEKRSVFRLLLVNLQRAKDVLICLMQNIDMCMLYNSH